MSESSHVPSLLISPTHDGMLGNWRSHGYILHGAKIGFEPMTFWYEPDELPTALLCYEGTDHPGRPIRNFDQLPR